MLVYKLLMGKFGLYQGSSNSLKIIDFGVVLEDVRLSIIVTMSKNTSLAAKGALAHRLQLRTACNSAPPAKSKMAARGLERCLPLGFWAF